MARKRTTGSENFLISLARYAEANISEEKQKITIARKTYLYKHRKDIVEAVEMGYPYNILSKFMTEKFLETDVPSVIKYIKDGEEIESKTVIGAAMLEEIYEAEKNKRD